MAYDLDTLPWQRLLAPVAAATAAIVRLDARLAGSPLRAGFLARQDFADAAAALWLAGELVHLEDLVLHDAQMDLRTPSHALTRAHAVLRARRLIFSRSPDWALAPDGLRALTGRAGFVDPDCGGRGGEGRAAGGAAAGQGRFEGDEKAGADAVASGPENPAAAEPLAHEFAALDAVLARAAKVLDGSAGPAGNEARSRRDGDDRRARSDLLYDPDGDEQDRLAEWQAGLAQSAGLPTVLRAALALEAWQDSAVLPQAPGLGALLAAALLRQDKLTQNHLASLNFGAQKIPRARRRARARAERVLALLDALGEAARAGLLEHDRLVLAKTRMARSLSARRASSKLPQLIDLVLSRPLVSTSMIQQTLAVSRQGALNLVAELKLREMTGRKRFQAWGIL